jgi:hypothetical protein
MEKALAEMNLQLHHVVADITGATGLRIVRAIFGSVTPRCCRACANYWSHASAKAIEKALTGHYRAKHLFTLEQDRHGDFYRRLSARTAKARVTATARKIAALFCTPYVDSGASFYETRYRTRVVENPHRAAVC